MHIRPYEVQDSDPVIRLSLRAWEPVFHSIEQTLSPELYQQFYPDWRVCQTDAVRSVCADDKVKVWVAESGGMPVGFVAAKAHDDNVMGEVYMLAVDPDYQRRGIATALTATAVDWMKKVGLAVAMVETGGDPGHAPARQAYAKFGFELFPAARYFKKL